jgi:hypothetical protein
MDTTEKYARWISKRVKSANYEIRTLLRAGKDGKGKILGGCSYWPDSSSSGEEHDRIQSRIEADAYASGYKIYSEFAGRFLSQEESSAWL